METFPSLGTSSPPRPLEDDAANLEPLGRVREEEVLYVLRRLLSHELWPGSLWAAFSDSPSRYAMDQPRMSPISCCSTAKLTHLSLLAVDTTLAPSLLIADAARRSRHAHLHRLFHALVAIAGMNSAERIVGEGDNGETVSARELAKWCLMVVGKEIGAAI